MKKISILLLFALTAFPALRAQTETEITVHDSVSGTNEVFDLPEGMTYSIDSLLQEWSAKKYLTPDSTCRNPDYNPVFTDEEYKERLQRMPAVMEMPYNAIVRKFIDQYSNRLRRSVGYMLGAANFYMPIFEEALDYYGLPLELKYLPVIESALDPTATSRAGAVGLWQFMLGTGKRYDLEVNSLIDERRDPVKSSFAAARYLRDLYGIYGDWNLVIAAYNCGPGNINKAIHRAGSKDYWTIYPYLPRETRGYVPAFIAANYIMNYYCVHNICPMRTSYPIATDTIVVTRDVHFKQIADLCHVDYDAVKALNPQYRTGLVPGAARPSVIRLPQDALMAFIDLKDSVYNYRADELFTRRAVVEVNEPQVSRSRTSVRSGSRSGSRSTARHSRRSRRGRSGSRSATTTVRQGQTLSEIARRNGTTVAKLRKLNGLKGSTIRAGRKLRVK